MRPDTEAWWRQAHADLATARVTMDGGRYYAASWFVQQAVEKALKALYIEQRKVAAPRTHNLNFLGLEVGATSSVSVDLSTINSSFDIVRYPDPDTGLIPEELVTEGDAVQHLAIAERVLAWVFANL